MLTKIFVHKTIPRPFPEKWASGYGEDEYGFWQSFTVNGIRCRLRWVNPGEFPMGSPAGKPEGEPERSSSETQHKVTITKGYWLAETACTQELWGEAMEGYPSKFEGERLPVEMVSWDDCQVFIRTLNQRKTGLDLRLPTEAEWEFACRASSLTPFSFGENIGTDQVNYDGNYPYPGGEKGVCRKTTVAVKSLPCNNWGFYEMHGNVWEWCGDWFGEYTSEPVVDPAGPATGSRRVLRGGGWFDSAGYCRSAYRYRDVPGDRSGRIGFRFARGQKEK